MVVRVKAIVEEHVHLPRLRQYLNGTPVRRSMTLDPGLPDEVPSFWVDVNRHESAVPVSKQCSGDGTEPETKVGACLYELSGCTARTIEYHPSRRAQ